MAIIGVDRGDQRLAIVLEQRRQFVQVGDPLGGVGRWRRESGGALAVETGLEFFGDLRAILQNDGCVHGNLLWFNSPSFQDSRCRFANRQS